MIKVYNLIFLNSNLKITISISNELDMSTLIHGFEFRTI